MTLDYSKPGKVAIRMDQYVNEFLSNVPEDMLGKMATPAAAHIYEVNPNAELLDPSTADRFHTLTAKLLFLCKRAHPDLQQAMSFLTTRVKKPDIDDWKKLRRVVKYLNGMKELYLTLEADNTHVVKWWVDAAFAVHKDMHSQTGGTMSMGKGSVYSSSLRQKLNMRSSTEAELVGVDDMMGMILWTQLFLQAQGYCTNTKLYQDNQSAMVLEKNGKKSSTKRTRHLDIRYFFITDCIKGDKLSLEYCPTEYMVADIFTKPLQGSTFLEISQCCPQHSIPGK
jgi:KUP system potassium uptake protein